MAFAHAVAAVFHILVSFAECLGASRLMDACSWFIDLWKGKHETGRWLEIEAAEAMSNRSDFSAMNASGIMLSSMANKQNESHGDLASEDNGKAAIDASADVEQRSKKSDKDRKSKVAPDALDKKTVGPIRKGKTSKMSPLDDARAHDEKLRAFKADIQKMKKKKEEEYRKRLEALKMEREKRIAAKTAQLASSLKTRKQLPTKLALALSSVKGTKFSDSEPGSSSPPQRSKIRTASSMYSAEKPCLAPLARLSSLEDPCTENSEYGKAPSTNLETAAMGLETAKAQVSGFENLKLEKIPEVLEKPQVKTNASSGMDVAELSKSTYMEFQWKKVHRYVIFMIDEKKNEVVVEKTGSPAESYDDFAASLPVNDCRYAVYDFDFVTSENYQRSKIFFIAWSPSVSRIRAKMLYATSKARFRRELEGIHYEIQATDPTEMDLEVIRDGAN